MAYFEKAQENKRAGEFCLRRRMYNVAASCLYYCLYIRAKEMLVAGGFDYAQFLRESPKIRNWQDIRNYYSHKTICEALTSHMHSCDSSFSEFEREEFANMWKNMLMLRLQADYSDEEISESDIHDCRANFQILWERIGNE